MAAGASIGELLLPQVVMRVISKTRKGRGPIGSWLGFHADRYDPENVELEGPNTLRGTGSVRNYTYRIFNESRVPMKGRAPGVGPGTVAASPVGENTVSVARFHQKIPLNYENLGNLARIAGPNSQVDQGGQDYIARQTRFLASQASMMVEMMAAGMLRDSLYFIRSGDDRLPTFTAPGAGVDGYQVNFGIPAGNKNQLNMLGTGAIIGTSWANVAAPIIGNLLSIIAAYVQLTQYPMTDVWINSLTWYNIITNTEVRNTAGSSNVPFAEYDRVPEMGMRDSGPSNVFACILRGQPNVTWHVCDYALALNTDVDPIYSTAPATATLNKLIPDNMAIFSTEPSQDWTQMYLGGEYVVENPGMAGALRQGWYFWHEYVTQPSVIELIGLLNAVPALYSPAVVAPATVIFP